MKRIVSLLLVLGTCLAQEKQASLGEGQSAQDLTTSSPTADPRHPALHPGFPYIWPYIQNPYVYPYYWPAYLYHGQYAKPQPTADNSKQSNYMETLVFVGKFGGTCKSFPNGLYYIDERSFAYCSNGIKTIQNCPEGAENPPLSEFYKGLYRFVHDFCSVNLLVNKVPVHPFLGFRYPQKNDQNTAQFNKKPANKEYFKDARDKEALVKQELKKIYAEQHQ